MHHSTLSVSTVPAQERRRVTVREDGGWQPADPDRHPCRTLGGTLVVFEGPRRVIWARRSPDRWRPIRLWPDDGERAAVASRIGRGEPVLVVVEELPCSVPLLTEEAELAPEELRPLIHDDDGPALDVPALDWLPAAQRERGERFAARSRSMLRSDPKLLLSTFLTDPDRGAPDDPVRFAIRTSARRTRDAEVAVLAWT